MGRGRVAILLVSAGLMAAAAVACNGDDAPSGPTGSGDNLKVDVDATTQAAQPPAMESGVEYGDGGYASAVAADGYAPAAWCAQCACSAGSFCFGGGTNFTSFDGVCDHVEAGPGVPLAIGCNLPPSGCDASDCACLITAIGGQLPCYSECVGVKTPMVYCASP